MDIVKQCGNTVFAQVFFFAEIITGVQKSQLIRNTFSMN